MKCQPHKGGLPKKTKKWILLAYNLRFRRSILRSYLGISSQIEAEKAAGRKLNLTVELFIGNLRLWKPGSRHILKEKLLFFNKFDKSTVSHLSGRRFYKRKCYFNYVLLKLFH